MGRAIRYTCSHCQRELFFDPNVGVSLESLSSLRCSECGESGAFLTLNVEPPADAKLLDSLPTSERQARASRRGDGASETRRR